MWTALFVTLVSDEAAAREYRLQSDASALSLDDRIRLIPRFVDVTRPDWVVSLDIQNGTDDTILIRSESIRCGRGSWEGATSYEATFGIGERSIDLEPGETKTTKLMCDHGKGATGDLSLTIARIERERSGEVLFTNVTWRMTEADLAGGRQAAGKQLATGAYDRPSPQPEAPGAEATEAPPPPPAAVLVPRAD